MLDSTLIGSNKTISLNTGTLTVPPECARQNPEVIYFRFGSDMVPDKNLAGDPVFTDSLKGGLISTRNGVVDLKVALVLNTVALIGNAHRAFEYNHHTMAAGNGPVFGFNVRPILEPDTLRLLRTDLIGLAGRDASPSSGDR